MSNPDENSTPEIAPPDSTATPSDRRVTANPTTRSQAFTNLILDRRISHGSFRLWHLLRDYENKRTGLCNPNYETISEDIGCAQNSIRRWIDELVAAGWLRCVSKPNRFRNGQPGRKNYYSILNGVGTPLIEMSAVVPPKTTSETPAEYSRKAARETNPRYSRKRTRETPHGYSRKTAVVSSQNSSHFIAKGRVEPTSSPQGKEEEFSRSYVPAESQVTGAPSASTSGIAAEPQPESASLGFITYPFKADL